jgi:serine/threonine-protein kinase HipA
MINTHGHKRGHVFVEELFAGVIEERDGLCSFMYDKIYLEKKGMQPVSLTLPLRKDPYQEKNMIPFFDGLIPEGWLLDRITDNWKIDRRDRMSLLLFACKDCIGNVSIVPDNEDI